MLWSEFCLTISDIFSGSALAFARRWHGRIRLPGLFSDEELRARCFQSFCSLVIGLEMWPLIECYVFWNPLANLSKLFILLRRWFVWSKSCCVLSISSLLWSKSSRESIVGSVKHTQQKRERIRLLIGFPLYCVIQLSLDCIGPEHFLHYQSGSLIAPLV